MRIGFWNCQRVGNIDTNNWFTADRTGFVWATVEQWLKLASPPDVLVLAEITQSGEKLATALNQDSFIQAKGYRAEFHAFANKNGGASPCSMLVIGKIDGRGFQVDICGGRGLKRPYLKITWNDQSFGACHAIANPNQALDEVTTIIDDLQAQNVSVLIGDMNYDFANFSPDYQGYNQWKPMRWGDGPSFQGKKTLDYVWHDGSTAVFPREVPPHTDWAVIDHAPIAFEI